MQKLTAFPEELHIACLVSYIVSQQSSYSEQVTLYCIRCCTTNREPRKTKLLKKKQHIL